MKKDFKMKQPFTKFWKVIFGNIKRPKRVVAPAFSVDSIVNEYNELRGGKDLFNIDFIKTAYTQMDDKYRYRLLGIMQYIKELERSNT